MKYPQDLRYTEKDEWIRVEGAEGTIGISDFAQDQLSDIVYVGDFPKVGATLNKGEICAVIESVKAASDVYAPAAGEVLAINEDLAQTPEAVNKDPYGAAWLVRIRIADPSALAGLMDAAAYETFCQGRAH